MTKPLTIEGLSKNENVMILTDANETIKIDLQEEGKVVLWFLKAGHTASDSKLNLSVLRKLFVSTFSGDKEY